MSDHWSEQHDKGTPPRRWFQFSLRTLFVVVTVAAIMLFALTGVSFLTVAKWVGGKTLDVDVLVIDTNALLPIADAQVTIFSGPQSPLEGSISFRKQSDFSPDPQSKDTQTCVTDSKGRCQFKYRFWAAGSDGILQHSGYVDTSRAWLRVAASDRPLTLVPLDRQSVTRRDIDDNTPIVVTVVLNKGPGG